MLHSLWGRSKKTRAKKYAKLGPVEYPDASLLGLPQELLLKIIRNLSVKEWLQLSMTCQALNFFVDTNFLYQDVCIKDLDCLQLFKKTISNHKKFNQLSLYVKSIEFLYPQKEPERDQKVVIAGFRFSNTTLEQSYISLLLEVISLLPNLMKISLSQVSPGFKFPEWTSTLKTFALEHDYYPMIHTLEISSEKGWTVPLRPNLLWPFGLIEELVLYDMILDSASMTKHPLLTAANEGGPLITKEALRLESEVTWSPIKSLTLSACSIASNGSRCLEGYFRNVTQLKLVALTSHYDIYLSNCFPSLKELYIDLNSKCFSLYNSAEVNSINVMNENSNYAYFESKFVPKFYLYFMRFIEVFQRLPLLERVCFINVSFTNVIPVDPDFNNDESNTVNNNGFRFLSLLQRYPRIDFIMLKNYKLHQPRTRQDWINLLDPCFTKHNIVTVKDKDGSLLFSRYHC